jgi:hypothetical protein
MAQDHVQWWALVLDMLSCLTTRAIIVGTLLMVNITSWKYLFPTVFVLVKMP